MAATDDTMSGHHGKIIVRIYESPVFDDMGQLVNPKACPQGPVANAGHECPDDEGFLPEDLDLDFGDTSPGTEQPVPEAGYEGMYSYCSGLQECIERFECIADSGATGKGFLLDSGRLLFGAILSSVSGCQAS